MKNLRGFLALNERGILGVITSHDAMFRVYNGFSIETGEYRGSFWTSKNPHVVESIDGLKAKAENSLKAFSKKTGKEL